MKFNSDAIGVGITICFGYYQKQSDADLMVSGMECEGLVFCAPNERFLRHGCGASMTARL